LALQYVKEQTPEICKEAVKNNPKASRYIMQNTQEQHASNTQKTHSSQYIKLSYITKPIQQLIGKTGRQKGTVIWE
jgi:hypothetical protein